MGADARYPVDVSDSAILLSRVLLWSDWHRDESRPLPGMRGWQDPCTTSDEWRYGAAEDRAGHLRAVTEARPSPKLRDCYDSARKRFEGAGLPRVASVRRRRRLAEDGDEVCVSRALAGDPDCFTRAERVSRSSRLVTLAVRIGGNARRSEEWFAQTVAPVVAAADYLESRGYSVRLVGVMALQGWPGQRVVVAATELKGYREPVHVDRLLCAGLPGTFRLSGFRWAEHMTIEAGVRMPERYGREGEPPPAALRALKIDSFIPGPQSPEQILAAAQSGAAAA